VGLNKELKAVFAIVCAVFMLAGVQAQAGEVQFDGTTGSPIPPRIIN